MRVILGKSPRTPSSSLRHQLNWSTLHQRRHNLMMKQVHRCALNLAPPYLCSKFTRNSTAYTTNTRGALNFHNLLIDQIRITTKVHLNTKQRFINNQLPMEMRINTPMSSFKSNFSCYFNSISSLF